MTAFDEWETPSRLFDEINDVFNFEIDVCASARNSKCPLYFDMHKNALTREWKFKSWWMNPPSGRCIKNWLDYAITQHYKHDVNITGVALLSVKTDTHWFKEYVWDKAAYVIFLYKRIKYMNPYNDKTNCINSNPSCLVVYSKHPLPHIQKLSKLGRIIQLKE